MPTPEARRRRRRLAGIVTLVWLVGGLTGFASSYYISESRNSELRHNQNAVVCVFRSILIPARAASEQAAHDKTQSPSARARARAAAKRDDTILASLLTAPRKLDCSKFKP